MKVYETICTYKVEIRLVLDKLLSIKLKHVSKEEISTKCNRRIILKFKTDVDVLSGFKCSSTKSER